MAKLEGMIKNTELDVLLDAIKLCSNNVTFEELPDAIEGDYKIQRVGVRVKDVEVLAAAIRTVKRPRA